MPCCRLIKQHCKKSFSIFVCLGTTKGMVFGFPGSGPGKFIANTGVDTGMFMCLAAGTGMVGFIPTGVGVVFEPYMIPDTPSARLESCMAQVLPDAVAGVIWVPYMTPNAPSARLESCMAQVLPNAVAGTGTFMLPDAAK